MEAPARHILAIIQHQALQTLDAPAAIVCTVFAGEQPLTAETATVIQENHVHLTILHALLAMHAQTAASLLEEEEALAEEALPQLQHAQNHGAALNGAHVLHLEHRQEHAQMQTAAEQQQTSLLNHNHALILRLLKKQQRLLQKHLWKCLRHLRRSRLQKEGLRLAK